MAIMAIRTCSLDEKGELEATAWRWTTTEIKREIGVASPFGSPIMPQAIYPGADSR